VAAGYASSVGLKQSAARKDYGMACGECSEKTKKSLRLLHNAMKEGAPFDKAAEYAGFDSSNQAMNALIAHTKESELSSYLDLIHWG
jgi:hypothetical protein